MALIKSYVHPEIGCTINLYDDACHCSEAEMAARRAALEAALRDLLRDPDLRERLAQFYAEQQSPDRSGRP